MIIGRDIVVIGIQAWDIEIGSNCKNIAEEMSRYNRVLYVNAPLDRNTKKNKASEEKVQKRIRIANGEEDDLYQLSPNMWNLYPRTMIESINWLPDGKLYDFINKRNNRKFAENIQSAIDKLGFKDYIIFNDSLMFTGLHQKELLKPKTYVYYMRDYLTKNPYWRKHGLRLEPMLIKKADVVVNNSTLYTEYGKQFNKHSYMVGQGCDVSLFKDENEKGYLIASSQGNYSYAIFERQSPHKYLGSFRIADGTIDGAEETDGLDIINMNLGEKFPYGMLVVQDGYNKINEKSVSQNFTIKKKKKIANLFEPKLSILNEQVDPITPSTNKIDTQSKE